jgi:hypothetical protein
MKVRELLLELERLHPLVQETRSPDTLWHYTDANGLHGILKDRLIRATHFEHLNDPSELRFGHDLVARAADDAGAMPPDPSPVARDIWNSFRTKWGAAPLLTGRGFFVACFCADLEDELGQWRAYGAFGAGYAIGFDPTHWAFKPERVQYHDSTNVDGTLVSLIREVIASASSQLSGQATPELVDSAAGWLVRRAVEYAGRKKHSAFRGENEWRIGVPLQGNARYRPTARGLVPFLVFSLASGDQPIPIRRIVVGPTNNSASQVNAVVGFLRSLGYENADDLVVPSKVPFRG